MAPTTLDGAYTVRVVERDGKAVPNAEIKDWVVRFADGVIIGTDRHQRVFLAVSYTLDTTKTPWKVNMKSVAPAVPDLTGGAPREKFTSTGLVKKDGFRVTFIYARDGGEPPTEFKTKAGQQMFQLENFAANSPNANPKP
jgi:uncharacterized protein (TIGR03067 family)